jgi:hypothetical protein
MKPFVAILPLVLVCQVQDTEDGPVPKPKWKSDYTEKTWGLKVKTVKYTANQSPAHVKVVLVFSKNLKADELKAVRDVFDRKEGSLEFCFFDEDGVIFAKATYMNFVVQGDISGMQGDAIRCVITANQNFPFLNSADQGKKVSKVELRPPPPK